MHTYSNVVFGNLDLFCKDMKLGRTCWITFWGKTRWIKQLLLGSPGFMRVFSTQMVRVTTGNGCFTNHPLFKKVPCILLTLLRKSNKSINILVGVGIWSLGDSIGGRTQPPLLLCSWTEQKRSGKKRRHRRRSFGARSSKFPALVAGPNSGSFFQPKCENADSSVSMVLFFFVFEGFRISGK